MQPTTQRKIRCEITNALKTPGIYELKESFNDLLNSEGTVNPKQKPQFTHRICETNEPVYHPFTRETELNRLLYCIEGQALLIAKDGRAQFITGGSGLLIPSGIQYDLLLGRGSQNWICSHWEEGSNSMVMHDKTGIQFIVDQDSSDSFRSLTQTVLQELDQPPVRENLIYAWLNLFVYESKPNSRSFSIIPVVQDETKKMQGLLDAMKRKPSADWNLKSAAKVTGYSPFHLSRLFKSTVNIGLPRFVEACRTEYALEYLLSGDTAMNVIADKSGFGTSQAMRSAIRERTGFLPSELRSRPHE